MRRLLLSLALPLGLLAATLQAEPLKPEDVPDPLKPWIDWVLKGHEDRACPFLYQSDKQRRCAWPAELDLDLAERRGSFTQSWQVYRESWVTLPGDEKHWPQTVTVDNQAAVVINRHGKPTLRLAPGRHRIGGSFAWDRLPESLQVPRDSGLVTLKVNARAVPFPDLSAKGELWLRKRDTGPKDAEGERLELQVFRRMVDEIPLQVVTHIDLNVSGAQREVVLGKALMDDFIPVSLQSPLPARLEPDGRLRIQVRPGRWVIELGARHPAALTELALAESPAPWPAEEIWVFDARNYLRLVEVEGVQSIDPRQTTLPSDWQRLPAYRLKAGDAMRFKVIRRGDPEPEPDKLALKRTLWLDFDGGGYTVMDEISGTMTRGWRLEAQPALELGRVAIDGQPQFITQLPESDQKGVEVRRGALNLSADSRYEEAINTVPALGWDQDFHQVSAMLNLPPGWDLFAASGVDNVPQTWLQRWTLLDLFLVLIAALAIGRLWGWPWALLGLATLGLLWHEPGAPRFVWLNLLAAIALLRVLPQGRIRRTVTWYRHLTLLALVLIAIPFMVDQVRNGLFPQLEQPWVVIQPVSPRLGALAPEVSIVMEAEPQLADEEVRAKRPAPMRALEKQRLAQSARLDQIDPKANIQTGPGLPQWQWRSIPLSWNGPVERDQMVELTLISPLANLVLNLLRVALLVALALLLAGIVLRPGGGLRLSNPRPDKTSSYGAHQTGRLATLALAVFTGLGMPQDAHADIPGPELLEELKIRLLEPPECLPGCAQSSRMRVEVTPDLLQLRLELHAQEDVAVPLPGHTRHWLPSRVLVDGAPAGGLSRTPAGELWLDLPRGRHQVILSGPLPPRDSVQLSLPLTPRQVTVQAEGWTVEGVHEDGVADKQLQLTRLRSKAEQEALPTLEPGTLPPFVRIERTLHLGLEWRVETRVLRLFPGAGAVVVEVPLLPGESVTTEGIRVSDGKVLVNMREQSLYWQSVLEKGASLTLTAPDTAAWSEYWRADIGPIWHVELEGIPVIHHQDPAGHWLPEWRPWPGESVTLKVSRPGGVEGRTLTIDRSRLAVKPGRRATDSTLELSLRSSQGAQHSLTLPETARLQSVLIDGRAQPIRQEGRTVTLPIRPGSQEIVLAWREPEGIRASLRTPPVDLATPSVNASISLALSRDRWVLLTGGPRLGPAVLFWGVLAIIVLIAVGLGRVPLTPIKTWQWLLLAIGLSQSPIWVGLIVVGWLLALGARSRVTLEHEGGIFNTMQVGLALLTLVALLALFSAVEQGLLGYPEMQIAGNRSNAYQLNWYQDQAQADLPQAWVLSVPLLVYRLLMLAWALWLAFALLRWLRWGWECFSAHGLWRSVKLIRPKGKSKKKEASPAETPDPPKT